MLIVHAALCTLFGVWIVLTVLAQFESSSVATKVKILDTFHLIPRWTFFAPNPCLSNYHLVYRDFLLDGSCSSWAEVHGLITPRGVWGSIWNPRKRRAKCFIDVVQMLSAHPPDQQPPVLSFGYIWALHMCIFLPRTQAAQFRQFAVVAVMRGRSEEQVSPLFVSLKHRLA